MKKYFLPLLILMFAILTPTTVSANSNLEISNTADFSNSSLDFNGGQTIFARIQSSAAGSKRSQLNLRDNQYNLINSFKLQRDGNYYTVVLAAPYESGYYSLEAQIESESSSSTSVRTIKVGNPSSAKVNVNVNNQKNGQSSNVLGEKEEETEASFSNTTDDSKIESANGGLISVVVVIFKEVFDFLWPFN